MAFIPGYKSRILIGDTSFSVYLNQFSTPVAVAMLDTTTFADNGVKRCIPGIQESTASLSGLHDVSAASEAASWTDTTPLTIAVNGLTVGAPVITTDALRANYTTGNQVADAVTFSLEAVTDGYYDFGVSLHDLEAETADESGTSVDNSASSAGGGVGSLHVTAFSGLSQAVVKVQHSTDNFSGSIVDLVTFSTVTGTTSQRSTVTGTVNRYLRYNLDVTGTGSITCQVSFARR